MHQILWYSLFSQFENARPVLEHLLGQINSTHTQNIHQLAWDEEQEYQAIREQCVEAVRLLRDAEKRFSVLEDKQETRLQLEEHTP